MKLGYIVALLMIVLMVGCATETQEAAPAAEEAAPAAEEAAPAAEEAAPAAEEAAPVEAETGVSDADQAHIDRLKAPCERGSIQSCLVLKNTYGIDWPPAVAEEPEASDEPVEPTE